MKSISLIIFFTTLQLYSFSQKNGESTISVKLNDTAMIYDRIVNAFVKTGFTMKDEFNKDTLMTKANSIFNPSGYAVIRAIISGNTVTFSGWYIQQGFGLVALKQSTQHGEVMLVTAPLCMNGDRLLLPKVVDHAPPPRCTGAIGQPP